MEHILIIGAGAAGLLAARTLSSRGYKVTIAEARDRIGGRMHTVLEGAFSAPIEMGAEFVHGNLPITLGLLKEADIEYRKLDGEMWHCTEGRFHQDDEQMEHWPELMDKLSELQTDCSIREFLDREFGSEKYTKMRASVIRFVRGFDAADELDASAFGLREEWAAEDDDQYRIDGGYIQLTNYIVHQLEKDGVTIHLSSEIKSITWAAGNVRAVAANGAVLEADKAIITLPIALLQAGSIQFSPALTAYTKAANEIGAGHVMKFLLQFKDQFWQHTNLAKLSKLQMLISDQEISTWWTQYPEDRPLLVGWAGGPPAFAMKDMSKDALLDKALYSLRNILGESIETLKENLDDWAISDWTTQPFTQCAYAYEKTGTTKARRLLKTPIDNTIYFAGEALYEGTAKGTVEAGFDSGREVALLILSSPRSAVLK